MRNRVALSVVIPVFNEERRMAKNLNKIIKYLSKIENEFEIILVDDGSTDSTLKIINSYQSMYKNISVVRHLSNMGKGAAVKTGMLKARGGVVLMTDCDLSTPIGEFKVLRSRIGYYDIVIGSRRVKEAKLGEMPERYRTFMGDIYYGLLRLLLLPSIKDTNCGFKLFNKRVIKPVFSRQLINRWGYDAEILYIASKLGFSVAEVGVRWSHYGGSKVRVVNAAVRTLNELMQIKLNSLKGKYD